MAIISFRHQFIFVKTIKTAGTSLEVYLAQHCGPDDIVTPIVPANPAHVPRNFAGPDGTPLYTNHMPAARIRALQPEAFETSFKFCFERHPVDKCLSHYAMLRNSELHAKPDTPMNWEQYLARGLFPVDTPKYTDTEGRVIVDRIYRYEELEAAMAEIQARIGRQDGPLAIREKSGFRHGVPRFEEVMARPAWRERILTTFANSLRLAPYC